MRLGFLEFNDVNALARQAVDLLTPEAELAIEETTRSNAYVYPQATGGDHGYWRVTVTIAPGNAAVLGLDPQSTPAEALAHLIRELSAASHGRFRGRYFPECPGHDHAAEVTVDGDEVVFVCPDDRHENARITPEQPAP